ncbi:MAG: 50S ribosomal protein L6 [Candidatus Omnitrophota bacterium]
MSRIGKKPIEIPKNVKIAVNVNEVMVEGPKGKMSVKVHHRLGVEIKDNQLIISRKSDSKLDKSLHGLNRTLAANMIKGITEGYQKELEIHGVGFRAQAQGKQLNMQLGFSHPVNYDIPDGITIETPKPTAVIIKGIDKAKVGEVAAMIRGYYKPEPYKGKGIRYSGEHVRRKAGKAIA